MAENFAADSVLRKVRCHGISLKKTYHYTHYPLTTGLSHEIAILAKVIWKRGIACKQSWRTVVWCSVRM